MQHFKPELKTCPICGTTGSCHIHDYYGRSIINFSDGGKSKDNLCAMRVFCDSCEHAHTILPDIIIPPRPMEKTTLLSKRLLSRYHDPLTTRPVNVTLRIPLLG